MKLVIQRVAHASVETDGVLSGRIGRGLALLLGIEHGDTLEQAGWLANKVVKLRLWPDLKDPSKQWATSVAEGGYELLVVSQFTLFATFKKPKPDFHQAMCGDDAKALYEAFVAQCKANLGNPARVATGVFGAMMQVDLRNDGPVTVELVAPPAGTGGVPESSPGGSTVKASPGGSSSAKPARSEASSVRATSSRPAEKGLPVASLRGGVERPPRGGRAEASNGGGVSTSSRSRGLGVEGVLEGLLTSEEEALLQRQPYLGGFTPTALDAQRFAQLVAAGAPPLAPVAAQPAGVQRPSAGARWYENVASFSSSQRRGWP